MIYIGIDVAKDNHDCCIIDSDCVLLNDSLHISNSRDSFEFLYSSILSILPNKDISSVKIGLESTGHYSTNLQNYLYSKGFKLASLNPLATNLSVKLRLLEELRLTKQMH
nr:IS110 family transposase [Clostridium paridis]